MIEATSKSIRYQTQLTSGAHSALSDTTRDKGGRESGFRPHDLLEAAVASRQRTCDSLQVRRRSGHLQQRLPTPFFFVGMIGRSSQ
jgi:putative redox protein